MTKTRRRRRSGSSRRLQRHLPLANSSRLPLTRRLARWSSSRNSSSRRIRRT
jgi:hypothetical protein